MADIKPLVIESDGSIGQMAIDDTIDGRDLSVDGTNLDAHLADTSIHHELYVQATEPVSWNVGDVWIETT